MTCTHSFVLSTFCGAEPSLGEGTRRILRAHNVHLTVTERRQEVIIRLETPDDIGPELRAELVAQENVFGVVSHKDER